MTRNQQPAEMKSLRQFANAAGVVVLPNGPGWGGRYGFRTKDDPDCMTCGFKSATAAREEWAKQTFGESAAKALFKLLNHVETKP